MDHRGLRLVHPEEAHPNRQKLVGLDGRKESEGEGIDNFDRALHYGRRAVIALLVASGIALSVFEIPKLLSKKPSASETLPGAPYDPPKLRLDGSPEPAPIPIPSGTQAVANSDFIRRLKIEAGLADAPKEQPPYTIKFDSKEED